jgi:hypothetical protein
MVYADIIKVERVHDDKRNKDVEVFTLGLRMGMKRWQVRRKYDAFLELEKILRVNFAAQCNVVFGTSSMPKDAAGLENSIIAEFLQKLCTSSILLGTSPTRQFFEIPSTRAMLDMSNDPTRSILSSPIIALLKHGKTLPDGVPKHITLADCLLIIGVAILFLPGFIGIPALLQPICASLLASLCVWYISQKEGLLDFFLEKTFGIDNVPLIRTIVRPADMPGVWMFVGVLLGLLLGSGSGSSDHYYSPQNVNFIFGMLLVRVTCILALMNFAFLMLIHAEKIKP